MSGEIKLRAWIIDEKWMGEVTCLQAHYGVFVSLDGEKARYFRFNEVELMRYVGRKDRKGKDICEGDIIHRPSINVPMIVRWNDEGACFDLTREPVNFQSAFLWYTRDCEKDYEILGNIHENPELMREKG